MTKLLVIFIQYLIINYFLVNLLHFVLFSQSESEFTVLHWPFAAPKVVPSGVQVRVANLPKKKNVHRDLKSAFVGVPGLLNIIPAVSGNKKTRDPVCKGFAFVDFKSGEYATRYFIFPENNYIEL